MVSDSRARRAVLFFLILVTAIVLIRAASTARGAAGGASAAGDRLARARVALYDPLAAAAPALRALGVRMESFESYEDLRRFEGDLIVVGPGGFVRGHEALGPILAARARSGIPVLILDQPTLPGTLTHGLRLWPAFSRSASPETLLARDHPVLRGIGAEAGASYFTARGWPNRPLLPPTRGNFRVLAEVRTGGGAADQEGVAILEFPLGRGTVLAAQASLCADSATDPRARVLLANIVDYLLAGPPAMKRAFLYARNAADIPPCLAQLSPSAQPAPADLEGVDLLLVPADWSAPRNRPSGLAPLARVAGFLHAGGTVVLLDPQPLVQDYLRAVIGAPVRFEAGGGDALAAASLPLLQGIAPRDLDLLGRQGQPELRLQPRAGDDPIEPVLLLPGLAQYRVGQGTLVALTLPGADECHAPRPSSLLSRLLTNLGVPLEAESRGDEAAAEISRLDE